MSVLMGYGKLRDASRIVPCSRESVTTQRQIVARIVVDWSSGTER